MSKNVVHTLAVFSFVVGLFAVPAISLADYTITTNSGTTGDLSFSSGNALGQGFTTIGAGTISSSTVCLYQQDTAGTVTVDIFSDSGGSPNASLGASTAVNVSTLKANNPCQNVTFNFSSYISVAASTHYFLVVQSSGNTYIADGSDGTGSDHQLRTGGVWAPLGTNANVSIPVVETSPPPMATSSPFDEIFGATIASTSLGQALTIVDNPNQDMANALFLFVAGFATMVMLFGKKK